MKNLLDHVSASATGGEGKRPLEDVMRDYSQIGYRMFELYMNDRGSAVDMSLGADYYRDLAAKYGMRYPSLHLFEIDPDDDASMRKAYDAARFAKDLGIEILVFNSTRKDNYARALGMFLRATEELNQKVLLQIHEGRSLDDMDEVSAMLEKFDHHPRLKVLHEVGSYHALGIHWKSVIDRFGADIALVHLKDMIGSQSVPFGVGDVDLPALIRAMDDIGYTGDYVVEIAPPHREKTFEYIKDAYKYLRDISEQTED